MTAEALKERPHEQPFRPFGMRMHDGRMKRPIMLVTCCAMFARVAAAQTNTAPPDLNDARVTIPYQELKSLWQAAQREKEKPAQPPKPPVAATLLSARYDIAVGSGQ